MKYQKTIYLNQNKEEVMSKLLQFRLENNLKSLFFMYATLNILSAEEKSEYLVEFYNLDKNKDGKIDF
jgi:flagellar motor switch protein FliG